ncbi:hypothetical protein QZH41_019218 [Actinostola sp. cb2023]|nr:hypothetical protein QZH41_019218 [Actinostola sp. cb2023]
MFPAFIWSTSAANRFRVNLYTLKIRRVPPVNMERASQVHTIMLPVTVLVFLATAQGLTDSLQKTVTADLQSVDTNRSSHSPGVSFSRNQSIPDIISAKIRVNKNLGAGCKNCGTKPSPIKGSIEYEMRIEMIKRQILDKLRMDEEPRIKRPRFGIPRPLAKKFQEQPASEENENSLPQKSKTDVIIIGNKASLPNLTRPTKARKVKFVFHVSFKVYKNDVRSAILWVHRSKLKMRQKGTMLTVKDSRKNGGDDPGVTPIVVTKNLQPNEEGWISIDVKDIVNLWKNQTFNGRLLNISNNHVLEIACINCKKTPGEPIGSSGLHRPFMVVDLVAGGKSRKKRAIDCRPGIKDCCRQEFYVSFEEMGWDNWIMIPKGFKANYCTGSCYGHILPMYHHTGVLQKLALQKKQREIAPCCSPTKLHALSLIYFDKDMNLFLEVVEKMTVEECGCS